MQIPMAIDQVSLRVPETLVTSGVAAAAPAGAVETSGCVFAVAPLGARLGGSVESEAATGRFIRAPRSLPAEPSSWCFLLVLGRSARWLFRL
jgi:hypothetical protein